MPLLVLGARQVGKTYIIDKFCKQEFKNYLHVNLLKDTEIINLYNQDESSKTKFIKFKLLLDFDIEQDDTILFIDEIQECEKLISDLKYICEEHPQAKIICAGSLLGVKLKRFKSSFPVGKVHMQTMYPMDFEEFLWAFNKDLLIEEIKKHYQDNSPIDNIIHKKALDLYRIYLITGGMPKCVDNMVSIDGDIIKYDKTIIQEIMTSYFDDMTRYVISESESLKIERIYKSIPSQLANLSHKFQYSKIEGGGTSRTYETALDWLSASNIISSSYLVTLPEIPLKGFIKPDTFKIYLSDVGILNSLLEVTPKDIMMDNLSLYKGIIAENYVANALTANGFSLYYWTSNNTAEIDFLIKTDEDGIIPAIVKAGTSKQSKSLKLYQQKYHPKFSIRISMNNFGFDNNIKSIPLYAIFCIKNNS